MSETFPSQAQRDEVEVAFRNLMILREGVRTTVYDDSLGKPTVGIGHLVVAADHLRVGETISEAQVDHFFASDSAAALAAAWKQAAEADISSLPFIPYLASVNFQLGVAWTSEFPDTWQMIVDGEYDRAADALNGTIWDHQTPVRVADFQKALRALPPKE